jgi:pro-sigmaK processing inhibitor BofA
MIEGIFAILLAVILAIIVYFVLKRAVALLINAIVGVILLFLINFINLMALFGRPDIPINWITVLVSAIGGLPGVIIVVLLHLFEVPLAV